MFAPGGDDGVDHVVADEIDDDLLQAGGDERAGEAEDDAAFGVGEHHVVDGGGSVQVARRVGHMSHRVYIGHDVVLGDVDVLDGGFKEFGFGFHGTF